MGHRVHLAWHCQCLYHPGEDLEFSVDTDDKVTLTTLPPLTLDPALPSSAGAQSGNCILPPARPSGYPRSLLGPPYGHVARQGSNARP